MSNARISQELQGKSVISVSNGQVIAKVVDVLIDPDPPQVAAVVTAKGGGGILKRQEEIEAIPSNEVQVWGQDAVLVSGPDVVVRISELPGSEKWLSVADQIRGHDVISTEGTRIGALNDVVVDTDGQFVSYDLAQAYTVGEGSAAKIKQIPVEATSSLGRDVLIVDAAQIAEQARLEEPLQAEEPPPVEETSEQEAAQVEE
jgi:uncharacterized protein YrrD